MSTPNAQGADKSSQELGITAEQAGSLFEKLLFPEPAPAASEEQQEPIESTPEPVEAVEPEPVEEPAAEPVQDSEPTPPKRSRKVKYDGKEVEVSEDEAYQGWMMRQDYTRKTQEAAEIKKAAELEAEAARKQREAYSQSLDAVQSAMDALVPKEPDWALLRGQLSPEDFANAHGEYTAFKKNYDLVLAEKKRVADQDQKDRQAALAKWQQNEHDRLLEALPEWHDETVRATERTKLRNWAKDSLGLTDEQVNGINDHKFIVAMRDAMLWNEAKVKSVPKPTPSKLKSAPSSGAPISKPKPVTERASAFQKLSKRGRIEDAANAFLHIKGLTD